MKMDVVAHGSGVVIGPQTPEIECCVRRLSRCNYYKTIMFMTFTVFILCLPLGDPETQCKKEICFQPYNNSIVLNYVCSIYNFLSSAMTLTTSAVKTISQYVGCVVLNALYDAKLKFYSILGTVDRQDLCRSVCCVEKSTKEMEDYKPVATKKFCRCKGKYCKRNEHTPSRTRYS